MLEIDDPLRIVLEILGELDHIALILSNEGNILFYNQVVRDKFFLNKPEDYSNIKKLLQAYYHDSTDILDTFKNLTFKNNDRLTLIKNINNTKEVIQWHFIKLNASSLNILVGYDISKQYKLEKNKSIIEHQLQSVIDSIAGNHWSKNLKGVYTTYNQSLLDTLGLTSHDQVIGKTDYELPWAARADELIENDNIVLSKGKTVQFEEEVLSATGEQKTFLTTKVPLRDEQHTIIGTVGTSVDITEIKRLEKELKNALAVKSEFIANMSHDIRTPITGMLGMVQDMLNIAHQAEASLDEKNMSRDANALRNLIETVKRDGHYLMGATDELLQLCNEILEVLRLESGKLENSVESFDIHSLIIHNIELLQPVARHKKLQLLYDIDSSVPQFLSGSRIYLDRVLLNLISNALKFTEEGSVKISVKLLHQSILSPSVATDEEINIKILVEDTGAGIPEDKFDTIFEHFSRLSPSYEGLYKGTGLGLYTVKRYIKAMSGNIAVSSELNKGTCFTVTVPLTVSDHADRVKQSVRFPRFARPVNAQKMVDTQQSLAAKDATASILVVEDNQLAAIAIKLALKPFHCHVETAETGSQAVKMAKQGQYDLILMDVGLPDFSGIEATKKIRKLNDAHKSQVPIVALTGHANNAEMRQHVLDAGMQEVLSKPAQPLALESVLQDYVFKVNEKKQPQPATSDARDESLISSVVIDWDGCVRMCHGDAEQARHMLSLLDSDLTELKVILAHAYAKHDTKTLREALHRTRGGVCYLKVPELEHALKTLHEAVKEVPQHSERLEKSYAALQQAINNFKTSWTQGK